jgi:hypothetical protein
VGELQLVWTGCQFFSSHTYTHTLRDRKTHHPPVACFPFPASCSMDNGAGRVGREAGRGFMVEVAWFVATLINAGARFTLPPYQVERERDWQSNKALSLSTNPPRHMNI